MTEVMAQIIPLSEILHLHIFSDVFFLNILLTDTFFSILLN